MKLFPLFASLSVLFSLSWAENLSELPSFKKSDDAPGNKDESASVSVVFGEDSLNGAQYRIFIIEMDYHDTMEVLGRHILQLIEDEDDFYYYKLKVGDSVIDLSSYDCEHFLVYPYLRSLGVSNSSKKREYPACHYMETKSINNEKIACFRFSIDNNNIEDVRKTFYNTQKELKYDKLALRIISGPDVKMEDFIRFYNSITSLQKPIAGICLEFSSLMRTPSSDVLYLPAGCVYECNESSDSETKKQGETISEPRNSNEK